MHAAWTHERLSPLATSLAAGAERPTFLNLNFNLNLRQSSLKRNPHHSYNHGTFANSTELLLVTFRSHGTNMSSHTVLFILRTFNQLKRLVFFFLKYNSFLGVVIYSVVVLLSWDISSIWSSSFNSFLCVRCVWKWENRFSGDRRTWRSEAEAVEASHWREPRVHLDSLAFRRGRRRRRAVQEITQHLGFEWTWVID